MFCCVEPSGILLNARERHVREIRLVEGGGSRGEGGFFDFYPALSACYGCGFGNLNIQLPGSTTSSNRTTNAKRLKVSIKLIKKLSKFMIYISRTGSVVVGKPYATLIDCPLARQETGEALVRCPAAYSTQLIMPVRLSISPGDWGDSRHVSVYLLTRLQHISLIAVCPGVSGVAHEPVKVSK